ncbi:MAG: pyruvate dehydrogenase (acetyl-transferring) E1 component subunit alpha [Thermodesulfovibrionales bacterium]
MIDFFRMPEETENFSVRKLQVLNERGEADASLMPELSDEDVKKAYEALLLVRAFDEAALNLQREGRIGTYAPVLGQEASQVGSALAIMKSPASPWVFPSFRENGVYITMGYPMRLLFQYWGGDERGMVTPEGMNIFPLCISVGTHIPHAAGAAMAIRHRGDRAFSVCYFGDGATSKGDFNEGMNMAGVFRLPAVFICQNNQWAISVPRQRQTAAKTLAQKAIAFGMEGVQVDGNDIFAVYRATREAVDRALAGDGPTFIECFTYRLADHTTADDASRYRDEKEVEAWREKEPLKRLRLYMNRKGLWSEDYEYSQKEKARAAVEEAVRQAEAAEPPDPGDIVRYTYEALTPRQRKEMEDAGWRS